MSTILSRVNKKQSGSGNVELALKVKAHILGAYLKLTATEGRHLTRQVGEGARVAQFPTVGRATGQRHRPGDSLYTDTGPLATDYVHEIPGSERLIAIDRPIVSPNMIDLHDESMSAYDFRGEYVTQQGNFLARAADLLRLIVMAIGGDAAANITGALGTEPGGQDGDANFDTGATASGEYVLDKFVDAHENFKNNHIPDDGSWVAYIRPTEWRKIFVDKDALDRIVHVDVTGAANGGTVSGKAAMFSNFMIVETTNMPDTNYTADPFGALANEYVTGEANSYVDDLSELRMLFGARGSIGTAVFGETGIGFSSEYEQEYLADAVVSLWAAGTQHLRPEAIYRVDNALIT